MDGGLIIAGAMTLLSPLLTKAGEKAAETIGEKLAEKTVEKNFWQKVKRLFIIEEEIALIEAIENKSIATTQDIQLIESKLEKGIAENSELAAEIQADFNLSSTNMFIAEQLLISIRKDRLKLKELFEERRDAGIETEGQYDLMIKRTARRLSKDEKDFIKLISNQ
jgi:hypothetical protein